MFNYLHSGFWGKIIQLYSSTYPEPVRSISPQSLAHKSGLLAIVHRLETIAIEGIFHLQGVTVICGSLRPAQTKGSD